MSINSIEELNALVARVKAQRQYASFTQQQVDKIFRAAALLPLMPAFRWPKWRSPNLVRAS